MRQNDTKAKELTGLARDDAGWRAYTYVYTKYVVRENVMPVGKFPCPIHLW